MYLNIEEKEDSIEKSAAVAGKPTKHFLFANEFNTVKNAINTLRHLITLNAGNIDYILSNSIKLELGVIEGSFITAINSMYEVALASPIFITYTIDDVFYVQTFVGNDSTYGTNSGSFVTAADFLPLYQSDSDEAETPSNQDNIPKKVTYTFAELGLDPATATHEQIIEAVKIANVGDELGENELRYIEVVEGFITYNFDITNNWEALGITDEDSFKMFALGNYGWYGYTISDFVIVGNRLKCNITEITTNPTFYIDMVTGPYIIHNFALQNIDGIITFNAGETTIENIVLSEGSRYLMLSELTNESFDINLPSSMTEVGITMSQLKSFTSPVLGASLTYLDLRMNQFTTADYAAMESWASSLADRAGTYDLQIDFQDNVDSVEGTNLQTILLSKGIFVIS